MKRRDFIKTGVIGASALLVVPAFFRRKSGRYVLFWHPQTKCPVCTKLEAYIDSAGGGGAKYELVKFEFDSPEAHELAVRLNVVMTTVILADVRNGEIVRSKDLTKEVWECAGKENKFQQMLRKELDTFFV